MLFHYSKIILSVGCLSQALSCISAATLAYSTTAPGSNNQISFYDAGAGSPFAWSKCSKGDCNAAISGCFAAAPFAMFDPSDASNVKYPFGTCLKISNGDKYINVQVIDKCEACNSYRLVDLGRHAFQTLFGDAGITAGVLNATIQAFDCGENPQFDTATCLLTNANSPASSGSTPAPVPPSTPESVPATSNSTAQTPPSSPGCSCGKNCGCKAKVSA